MLVTEHRLASERAFFVLFLKEQKLLSANALRKIKNSKILKMISRIAKRISVLFSKNTCI